MKVKNNSKRLVDSFKPKRPTNSFLNFYLSVRKDILRAHRYLNLIKHASMVKIAKDWWGKDGQCQDEKKDARRKYDYDLNYYKKLMKIYNPPTQEELIRRRKEMPKRFRTNWNYFVKTKFGNAYKTMHSFGAVATFLAKEWNQLPPEMRKPFNDQAVKDRFRYENAMKAFEAKYMVTLD